MKYRILVSFFILFIATEAIYAQKDATAEINKIKLSNKYISATGSSMNSREEASEYGKLLLADEIERWLRENVKGDISGYVTKSKENAAVIETQRGKLYRSFIYVKKSDILPYFEGETIIADTPQAADTSQVVDISQSEYVDISSPDVSSTAGNVAVDNKKNNSMTSNPEETKMLDILNTKAFNQYLGELKKNGLLKSYGMQKAWPEEGTVYVFFIDSNRLIKEHIRLTDGKALDLSNGTTVNMTGIKEKYNSGTYIWFTLK